MSSLYNLEPPTKGKVAISTVLGDVEIELWPKEAPLACRNFVQLCLEGFYQKTTFHRIVPRFMIQAGDETGTGRGGVSIYGPHFKDEFHSRLKFTHRGIVACANQNAPDTNNSQFFITLDRCEDLDKRYTIFGKVAGDTIFNALRIAEVPVNSRHQPVEPVHIENCEVLWNPFEDIVPRVGKLSIAQEEEAVSQKKEKKASKNLALLSFGEDEEIEEMEQNVVPKKKIKSAHDVLKDSATLIQEDEEARCIRQEQEEKRKHKRIENVRNLLKTNETKTTIEGPSSQPTIEEKVKAKVESTRVHVEPELKPTEEMEIIEEEEERPQLGFDRLYVKKKKTEQNEEEGNLSLMDEAEQTRVRLKYWKKLHGDREKNTLAKLEAFQSSLKYKTKKIAPSKPIAEKVNVELPAAWRVGDYLKDMESIGVQDLLHHELQFDKSQKDSMSRDMHALDDYIVVDTRLENGSDVTGEIEKWDHKPNV